MPRRAPNVETDTLSLSFLDLISCGLGGAIFLSLVFSVVRQDKPTPLISQHFLDVTVLSADPDAVLNFVITPPGSPNYFLPLTEFQPVTGQLPPKHELRKSGNMMLLGFSAYGDIRLKTKEGHYYKLLVHDPKPGRWIVEVQYRDRRDWTNVGQAIQKVEVRRKVITSRGGQLPDTKPQQVGFGYWTDFDGEQTILVENPRFGNVGNNSSLSP